MDDSGRKLIVLFGDSLTQLGYCEEGWVSSLNASCVRRAHVHNFGFNGYNTRCAIQVLDRVFPLRFAGSSVSNNFPDFVTVCFGVNDAALPNQGEASVQHVPLNEYYDNLVHILRHIRSMSTSAGKTPEITVIGVLPPNEIGRNAYLRQKYPEKNIPTSFRDRTADTARKYSQAAKQAALTSGCTFLDMFNVFLTESKSSKLSELLKCDGLHLSRKGNFVFWDALHKHICEFFPHLHLFDLKKTDFPGPERILNFTVPGKTTSLQNTRE